MGKQQLNNLIHFILLFPLILNVPETLGEELYHSTRSIGQACSMSASPYSIISRYDNPAGAGWRTDFGLSVDYYRRFELKELDSYNFIIFRPISGFGASLHGYRFGGDLYSIQSLSASISRISFKRLSTGIKFGKEQLQMKNYGEESRDFLEMGLLANFKQICIGLHTMNLMSTDFQRFTRDNSFSYRISILLKPNNFVELYSESVLYEETDPDFAFGITSQLTKRLQLRVGYHTTLETIHVGLGINSSGLCFDSGFYHHPDLGWSQAYGMSLGKIDGYDQ